MSCSIDNVPALVLVVHADELESHAGGPSRTAMANKKRRVETPESIDFLIVPVGTQVVRLSRDQMWNPISASVCSLTGSEEILPGKK